MITRASADPDPRRHILVVQRRLTHYRVPFFERLRESLAERGIDLTLAHGSPSKAERSKGDEGRLSWAVPLPTHYVWGERLCWQPFGAQLPGVDLAVLTLENKLIYNLYVQYQHRQARIALWGHGANLQGNPESLRELFKRRVARQADWWFGYTDMSVPLIRQSGFPADRITVLNNSVDTAGLVQQLDAVTDKQVQEFRQRLGLRGSRIGLFIGSLYAEKRIGFMLEAATRIRDRLPDFEFILVGGGPERSWVEAFCSSHSWCRYAGVLQGADKATALRLASVMLNPGLVGLGVLDAFAAAVPMVTTNCGLHSPEVVYLEHGHNGLMTSDSCDAFADAVTGLLRDASALEALRVGCRQSRDRYSIDQMAARFVDGVEQCLASPMLRF